MEIMKILGELRTLYPQCKSQWLQGLKYLFFILNSDFCLFVCFQTMGYEQIHVSAVSVRQAVLS